MSVLDGAETLRIWEVEATEILYGADEIAADFSGGSGSDVWVSVAQSDGRLGWGAEARVRLVV